MQHKPSAHHGARDICRTQVPQEPLVGGWEVKVPCGEVNSSKAKLGQGQRNAGPEREVEELVVPNFGNGPLHRMKVDFHTIGNVETVPPHALKDMWLPPRKIQRRVAVWARSDGTGTDEDVGEWEFWFDDDRTGNVLRLVSPAEVSEQCAEDKRDSAELEGGDGHTEGYPRDKIDDEPRELHHRDDACERVKLVLVLDLRVGKEYLAVVDVSVNYQVVQLGHGQGKRDKVRRVQNETSHVGEETVS